MNILMCVESFYDGGAEMFAIRLANEMSSLANIIFLELYPYRTKRKHQKAQINKSSVTIIHAGQNQIGKILHKKQSKNRIKRKLLSLYNNHKKTSIISIIKKFKIDIIHSHSWETDLFFAKLKSSVSFKLVASFHGHYELMSKRGLYYERNTKIILSQVDKIVYLTSEQMRTLDHFNFPLSKREKIFHGIKIALPSSPWNGKSSVLKCVMVARGVQEKGWLELVEAFNLLFQKYPRQLELHLIGEGVFLDELKSKYSSELITFHGYREDVVELVSTFDLCLLPSYSEHLPIAVIEYLTCGKPVIATDTGAIKEMISYENKQAGILIGYEHGKPSVNEIVLAVETYLQDPEVLCKQSEIAIQASKKFEMKLCRRKYYSLYQGLVAGINTNDFFDNATDV